ncbi:MAG: alpha/beta hydrolase fold protein [Chitinophagaceae bacterium]|nr:MAG: alpha/beta hydrolase fold protein [Chitinophagaceae bacterium]
MNYEIKEIEKFKFVEVGEGETLLLLHGLFGAMSNFEHLVNHFSKQFSKICKQVYRN